MKHTNLITAMLELPHVVVGFDTRFGFQHPELKHMFLLDSPVNGRKFEAYFTDGTRKYLDDDEAAQWLRKERTFLNERAKMGKEHMKKVRKFAKKAKIMVAQTKERMPESEELVARKGAFYAEHPDLEGVAPNEMTRPELSLYWENVGGPEMAEIGRRNYEAIFGQVEAQVQLEDEQEVDPDKAEAPTHRPEGVRYMAFYHDPEILDPAKKIVALMPEVEEATPLYLALTSKKYEPYSSIIVCGTKAQLAEYVKAVEATQANLVVLPAGEIMKQMATMAADMGMVAPFMRSDSAMEDHFDKDGIPTMEELLENQPFYRLLKVPDCGKNVEADLPKLKVSPRGKGDLKNIGLGTDIEKQLTDVPLMKKAAKELFGVNKWRQFGDVNPEYHGGLWIKYDGHDSLSAVKTDTDEYFTIYENDYSLVDFANLYEHYDVGDASTIEDVMVWLISDDINTDNPGQPVPLGPENEDSFEELYWEHMDHYGIKKSDK